MYHLLADFAFSLHLAFIIFVILGAFLVWRWPWLALLHILSVIWSLAIQFLPNVPCPLTPLEQMLLRKAGEEGYTGGFVDHYIVPLIYPEVEPRFHYEAGVFLLVVNLVIYVLIIIRIRSKRSKR
ncbi:MAG: DUF2784 domain-containing protein [Deltaproteobacteria bacterium]|nr:DUF2784 domain-containing protein [Deltaproteobacteria bacterium]